jgi:chromate reductase, NAD(P)H dehydrogenase (quinone)
MYGEAIVKGIIYPLLCCVFKTIMSKKKVLAICGSTRTQSANLSIIQYIGKLLSPEIEFEIYNKLSLLPHFNPDLDKDRAPEIVEALRNKIKKADGVLICTPEYVFSLPGALKNVIEWCVSTTIFSEKPVAFITASASGVKAHESLQLVMKTIYANVQEETQLLIQGAKGKINSKGEIADALIAEQLKKLVDAFTIQLNGKENH